MNGPVVDQGEGVGDSKGMGDADLSFGNFYAKSKTLLILLANGNNKKDTTLEGLDFSNEECKRAVVAGEFFKMEGEEEDRGEERLNMTGSMGGDSGRENRSKVVNNLILSDSLFTSAVNSSFCVSNCSAIALFCSATRAYSFRVHY